MASGKLNKIAKVFIEATGDSEEKSPKADDLNGSDNPHKTAKLDRKSQKVAVKMNKSPLKDKGPSGK